MTSIILPTVGRDIVKNYCMKEDSRVQGPWSDRKIYQGKDLPSQLWPWQEEVLHRCQAEPDNRTVNCIIDTVGNTGKSVFCKLMGFKHGALVLPWGRTSDLLNLVCKMGHKEIYLFDLSRSKPQDWARDDISAAIESIKNGYIVNTKYETSLVYQDPSHVWCFSNQAPNLSSLSRDRWKFWEINGLRQLVRVESRRLKELDQPRQRDGSPGREVVDLSD